MIHAAAPSAQAGQRQAHFRVPARLEEVSGLAVAVRAFLESYTPETVVHAVELGISEAFNNIVQHGRPDAQAVVACSVDSQSTVLVIELEDRGEPIPARALDEAGSARFEFDEQDLSQLPEGGMGLALLKMSFDKVSYRSQDGVNVLHLEKHIASPAS